VKTSVRFISLLVIGVGICAAARGGGAWVPDPGHGDIQLGYSQKTAHTSFDPAGDRYTNLTTVAGQRVPTYHDFRYGYLSGEIGIVKNLSTRVLVTYLYGLEGPKNDEELNHGLSDAWIGLKYGFRQKTNLPMAVAVTLRTPYFYDLPGPYDRHLFDSQGNIVGNSPEWRGLLKKDLTLSSIVSHSFREGRGWASLEVGYTWREGAPADQIPVWAEIGYPLPFWKAAFKGSVQFVRSRYNYSARQPDDRFGSSATNNFNAASMLRVGASMIVPLGSRFTVEAGYGQWVWGRSARRYKEPYASFGYRL
jgi:hypothetical protein